MRLLVLLMTTIAFPATATAGVHAGVRGGMTSANTTRDLELDGFKIGYAVGGFLVLTNESSRFAMQFETLFGTKGDKGNGAELDLQYLEFQPLIKMTFAPRRNVAPSLFVGQSLSFNAQDLEASLVIGDVEVVGTGPRDPDAFNTIDFGLVFGGSLEMPVAGQTLGIDVRYSRGLTNIWDSSGSWLGLEGQNRVFTVTGFWLFI